MTLPRGGALPRGAPSQKSVPEVGEAFAGVVDCGPSWGGVSFTCKLAPSALLVFPCVEAVNFGSNASAAQSATWKRLDTAALAPSAPVIVPVILIGLQLVGLNVKPGTVDVYVDVPYLQRDAVDDGRERVRGVGHRGLRGNDLNAVTAGRASS